MDTIFWVIQHLMVIAYGISQEIKLFFLKMLYLMKIKFNLPILNMMVMYQMRMSQHLWSLLIILLKKKNEDDYHGADEVHSYPNRERRLPWRFYDFDMNLVSHSVNYLNSAVPTDFKDVIGHSNETE